MKIGIIGLGLIGGSFALSLKNDFDATIFGMDKYNLKKAKQLMLIDYELNKNLIHTMDVVIIATPVNTIGEIAIDVLDKINPTALVFDTGSTKYQIAKTIENHPKRSNYLLTHPIAGTEYSGPSAAFEGLFNKKINIICDLKKTKSDLVNKAKKIFLKLKMQIIEMESKEHDRHIAYVSHLSHISSFMLGKTVMDLEKNEKNIFDMAGSGFASTVRLAKSSPSTWTPIFIENKTNILQSLDEYINNLIEFRNKIIKKDKQAIFDELTQTNYIRNIIDKIEKE